MPRQTCFIRRKSRSYIFMTYAASSLVELGRPQRMRLQMIRFWILMVVVGHAIAGSAAAQLNQITSCVEVPSSEVDASRRRGSTRLDCNPQTARNRARNQSRINARDALAPTCRNEISAAEAEEICRLAGGFVPDTGGTSLSGPTFTRSGGSAVDTALPITNTGGPKLCATLRNLSSETVTTTRENIFCVLNNGRETSVNFFSRARCGVQCFEVARHQLRVRRFSTTAVPDGTASNILINGTQVLQTDDGAGDVSCRVSLSRLGANVTVFNDGDGSIDSAAEFNTIVGLTGDAMVLNAINFCGALIPNVVGCAPGSGSSFVVVRVGAVLEPMLWVHEFGHTRGLPHRNNNNNVMNSTLVATTTRINTNECGSFRGGDLVGVPNALLQPMESSYPMFLKTGFAFPSLSDDARIALQQSDIRAFVRQIFIHGVPYHEAVKYGESAIPTLVEMLNDRSEEQFWSNIVVVLGMIGNEQALDQMILFIERDKGQISETHYKAKTATVMSLGYIVNRTRSERALDYLTRGLDSIVWTGKLGVNQAPYQRTLVERDVDFGKYSILGLALSGHPKAAQVLRALEQRANSPGQQKLRMKELGLIGEMLREHRKIATQGLANYYKQE